jgi:hypothetical protein
MVPYAVFCYVASAMIAAKLASELRTGVATDRLNTVRRRKSPLRYWTRVGFGFVLLAFFLYSPTEIAREPRGLFRSAKPDIDALSRALSEGDRGPVAYLGDAGGYSYFRVGHFFYTAYKVPMDSVHPAWRYPYDGADPYSVTKDVIRH